MSKYSGLPDIDTAAEVYETHPEARAPAAGTSAGADDGDDEPRSAPDIERPPIDARAARAAFQNAAPLVLQGAGEGPRARLLRLQLEVDDMVNAAADPEDEAVPAALLQQARALQERLGRIELVRAEAKVGAAAAAPAASAIPSTTNPGAPAPSPALASLDRRLAAIESRLGTPELTGETLRPILPTLSRLDAQLRMLTPAYLDTVRQRARLVLADLEQVEQRQTDDADAAMSSLYELQRQIEPLVPLAPALLTRLQTLEGLHAAAASFASRLSAAEDANKGAAARLAEVHALLSSARASLADNMGVVHGNLSALETRVNALDARMRELSTHPS